MTRAIVRKRKPSRHERMSRGWAERIMNGREHGELFKISLKTGAQMQILHIK